MACFSRCSTGKKGEENKREQTEENRNNNTMIKNNNCAWFKLWPTIMTIIAIIPGLQVIYIALFVLVLLVFFFFNALKETISLAWLKAWKDQTYAKRIMKTWRKCTEKYEAGAKFWRPEYYSVFVSAKKM